MKTAFIALIIIILSPTLAHAMGELEFKKIISPIKANGIDSFLNERFNTGTSDYIIAQADLNNDHKPEFFLKRNYCETKKNQLCSHIILGKTESSYVLLGNIRTKKLVISSTKTHNISDILAFDNDLNDYKFDIYMWSPNKKMYILKAN